MKYSNEWSEIALNSFEYEEKRLQDTLQKMMDLETKLQNMPRYYGKDPVEQVLDDQRQNQLKNLRNSQSNPYFGRLDFAEKGVDPVVPLYIGKAGIQDEETNELIVIDWRAPVSSLFYSFAGSNEDAFYTSPEGVVEGKIHLKRNIAIQNQILQRVVDSYVRGNENIGVTDEFLLHRLNENKDSRLLDIVSTIQSEQDQIIRADYNQPLIIQGVPGSGKTTVALHRLAYLLYQYQHKIKAEKMIIFAPNNMFIDYISEVLPELGVGDIQQTTFSEWALAILGDGILLKDRGKQVAEWFSSGGSNRVDSKIKKGDYEFLTTLTKALNDYEKFFVPEQGFTAWDQKHLSIETIREWFFTEYRHDPLMKRKERLMARIKRWLETEYKEIRGTDSKGKLKKQANKLLRNYLKTWPNHTVVELYQWILEMRQGETTRKKASSKKKEVDYEDLAPLVFIQDRLFGIESKHKYDHVVIDEAQDFSPAQVAVLKEHCRSQSFTILGDMMQNINAFQGIDQWDEFSHLFHKDQVQFHQLDRSYRSTMEIIHFANEVIQDYIGDVTPAKPIFRSGKPVEIVQTNKDNRMNWLKKTIKSLMDDQMQTIAVVTRDEAASEEMFRALESFGQQSHLIHWEQKEYLGGISVAPIYLTKGMEFDAVILMDVDPEDYPDDALHAKLLFVGCTRALHQLFVVHEGQISPLVNRIQSDLYQVGKV